MALNLDTETLLTGDQPQAPAAAPAIEDLTPHFPQLEILECLGRGGMGVVYKARQKTLHRMVALKLLAPERETDPAFAERFAREARALATLSHPNIVTVHDFGQAGGYFYLLMEFVDGVNLRQAMTAGRFTPEQALAVVPPICEALQYAHERGVVHRDIKPENLLLDKEGRLKIADFGIAKMIGARADAEAAAASPNHLSTMAAGTPQYMAPEQAVNPAQVDHRADIYSLGVVLYELLTGERPNDKMDPPSKRVQIDVRLDEIVLRALEKDPERRYATAAEFRTRVDTYSNRGQPPLPPRGVQKLFQSVMPRHWFEAMRLQSQDWHMVCPCGHEISVWDAGGIRFAAAGNPRRMMFCPACHQFRLFTTVWRGPAVTTPGSVAAAASGPGGLTVLALCLTSFYSLVVFGVLFLDSLPINSESVITIPISVALPIAILFSIFWLNRYHWEGGSAVAGRYLKGFAWVAWVLALPLIGLGLFFLYGAATGGGSSAPHEIIMVSLTWLGAVLLPWAGWRLWSVARPAAISRGRVGCVIAIIIAVLFLIGLAIPLAIWTRSRQTVSEAARSREADERAVIRERQQSVTAVSDASPDQALETAGIGLILSAGSHGVLVEYLLPNSPAARVASINVGDVIKAIGEDDGPLQGIKGWPLQDVVARLRGTEGSKVSLLLMSPRQGVPDLTHKVILTRQRLPILEADAAGQVNLRGAIQLRAANDPNAVQTTVQAFDQSPGRSWRALADAGRYLEAAQLIEAYLSPHSTLSVEERTSLHFHAAHCLAMDGASDSIAAALDHLRQAKHASEAPDSALRWNDYVSAIEAFLKDDLPALKAARERIASGPKFNGVAANLDVVDRLIENFGKPYAVACKAPAGLRR